MKTEVYSWRVSTELKMKLEHEARRRNISVSALLDLAARDLLEKRDIVDDEEAQRRIHAAVLACAGTLESDGPFASAKVSETVKQRLRRKYGR
jgi:hypothetical protein